VPGADEFVQDLLDERDELVQHAHRAGQDADAITGWRWSWPMRLLTVNAGSSSLHRLVHDGPDLRTATMVDDDALAGRCRRDGSAR
jgi:hypothetical protein